MNLSHLDMMCTPKVGPRNLTLRGAFFMAKYDVTFKMKVVTEYLEGMNGYKILAQKYSMSDTKQIRTWVNQFQQYGMNGLKRKRMNKKYTGEFKMDVLHYMKRTGASHAGWIAKNNLPLFERYRKERNQ